MRSDPVEVPLTQGYVAIIDADDAGRILRHKWRAKRSRKSDLVYAQRSVRLGRGRGAPSTCVMLHHEVMNRQPGQLIDHRNGDPLDNRKGNLRVATNRQNTENQVGSNLKRGGFKGVYQPKKTWRWCAGISAGEKRPNGKRKRLHLGSFDTPEEAAAAYDLAAVEHFGDFAALNFPDRRADYENEVALRAAQAEFLGSAPPAVRNGGGS